MKGYIIGSTFQVPLYDKMEELLFEHFREELRNPEYEKLKETLFKIAKKLIEAEKRIEFYEQELEKRGFKFDNKKEADNDAKR